jgi:UDP-2,3-diacylglucosamine pyrophosphatase LpxH
MFGNQSLIDRLERLLVHKKSKSYYAEKLGIAESDVDKLLDRLRAKEDAETSAYIAALEERVVSFQENLEKGTGEIVYNSSEEIRTLDQLIDKCKIETSKWEIVRYVQNYWGNKEHPHWQVKAWLSKKQEANIFQQSFVNFLSTYSPVKQPSSFERNNHLEDGCLVINKQDAHYNKLDVYGNNSMTERFEKVENRILSIIKQATSTNILDRILYIVGSDELNSEFTSTTTKGTPQTNISTYHEAFEKVCQHETSIIDTLLENGDEVHVFYVPGNHDEYVGWHIITWLSAYYRFETRVTFETSPRYRKYVSYGNSAIMLNHGDVMKANTLATVFPSEYRENWSQHEHFYILTGDKHHESTQSINGIKFYQIPAFSNASSGWDERKGYSSTKGEVTAFLIDKMDGMTTIFKRPL